MYIRPFMRKWIWKELWSRQYWGILFFSNPFLNAMNILYTIYFGIIYWSNVASEKWEFYPRSPRRLKKQAYFSYQLLHNKHPKLRGLKQWFIICHNSLSGWLGDFSAGLIWDHSCSFTQLVVSGDSWVSLSIWSITPGMIISRHFSKRVKEA